MATVEEEVHPRIEPYASFGEWVDRERLRLGMQKRELAKRCGVSTSWLSTIIAGGRRAEKDGPWQLPSPSDAKLIKLADGLDVERAEVFRRLGREYTGPERFAIEDDGRLRMELTEDELEGVFLALELEMRDEDPRRAANAERLDRLFREQLAAQPAGAAVLERHPRRA